MSTESWERHATLLDAQPSSRRLMKPTPRSLDEAGIFETHDPVGVDWFVLGICLGLVIGILVIRSIA